MQHLDLTLPTPAENLALDEALLDEAEAAGRPTETLRFWEPTRPMVVVGRSSRIDREVDRRLCRLRDVPILRRSSGGAAIVAGPGCLMYALVLSLRRRPELRAVDQAHRGVLGTIAGVLGRLVEGVACRGTSDLVLGQRKFSGNSIRAKRDHLLYHGTLLYDFPVKLIGELLPPPPREPAYRAGRPHEAFVVNLPLDAGAIRNALLDAWQARTPRADWPETLTAERVAARYGRPQWNETP